MPGDELQPTAAPRHFATGCADRHSATVGFVVQVVKATALTSVIGFIELTKAGTMITNATFKPFLVYGCVALIYFALCYPISLWSRSIERRPHARS